eukprot:c14737_g1_i1 orf=907-1206(+)
MVASFRGESAHCQCLRIPHRARSLPPIYPFFCTGVILLLASPSSTVTETDGDAEKRQLGQFQSIREAIFFLPTLDEVVINPIPRQKHHPAPKSIHRFQF